MSKYRKIDPRIWNDVKFRELSDDGKLTFLFILTHPHMTSLGAMRGSLSGLATELGWAEKAFREAFQEASAKGMLEHDDHASYIGVPKFLRYNGPESPNVVKSWLGSLDLIPECLLKDQLLQRVKDFVQGLPIAFRKALPIAFGKALPEAFAKGMANQEQEQEPEPEPEQKRKPASPAREDPDAAAPREDPDHPSDEPRRTGRTATGRSAVDSRGRRRKPFVPPTVEQVRAYISANPELQNVEPRAFVTFFEDGDPPWTDSRGKPVINWKQKLRTWSNHNGNGRTANGQTQRAEHRRDFDVTDDGESIVVGDD